MQPQFFSAILLGLFDSDLQQFTEIQWFFGIRAHGARSPGGTSQQTGARTPTASQSQSNNANVLTPFLQAQQLQQKLHQQEMWEALEQQQQAQQQQEAVALQHQVRPITQYCNRLGGSLA